MTTAVEYVTTLISKMFADASSENPSSATKVKVSANSSSSMSSKTSSDVNALKASKAKIEVEEPNAKSSLDTRDTKTVLDNQKGKSNPIREKFISLINRKNRGLRLPHNIPLNIEDISELVKLMQGEEHPIKELLNQHSLSPQSWKLIIDALHHNKTLKRLGIITSSGFGVENVKALAEALRHNNILTQLTLGDIPLGSESGTAFAKALEDNLTLNILIGWRNNLDLKAMRALANALQVNTCITALSLEHNKLGSEDFKIIADILKVNKTLGSLILGNNNPGLEGLRALAIAFLFNKTFHTLELAFCELGEEGVEGGAVIATMITGNKSLIRLNLKNNRLDEVVEDLLSTALQNNETLTALDLGNNDLRGEKVAAAIRHPKSSLLFLGLDGNQIGHKGSQVIAETLKVNHSLLTLSSSGNYIGGLEALEAMMDAMATNSTMTSLDLSENRQFLHKLNVDAKVMLSETQVKELSARRTKFVMALKGNTSLTRLNLSRTAACQNDDGKIIAEILRGNKTLTELIYQNNHLNAKSTKEVAVALQHNTTLNSFDLAYNSWDSEGIKALTDTLKRNTTLSNLSIFENTFVMSLEDLMRLEVASKNNKTLTRFQVIDFLYSSLGKMFASKIISIMNHCNQNFALREKLQNNWSAVCVALSFTRANSSNALKHSVLPLLTMIQEFSDFGNRDITLGVGNMSNVKNCSANAGQNRAATQNDFMDTLFFMHGSNRRGTPNNTEKLSEITSDQKSADRLDGKGNEKPGNGKKMTTAVAATTTMKMSPIVKK